VLLSPVQATSVVALPAAIVGEVEVRALPLLSVMAMLWAPAERR